MMKEKGSTTSLERAKRNDYNETFEEENRKKQKRYNESITSTTAATGILNNTSTNNERFTNITGMLRTHITVEVHYIHIHF